MRWRRRGNRLDAAADAQHDSGSDPQPHADSDAYTDSNAHSDSDAHADADADVGNELRYDGVPELVVRSERERDQRLQRWRDRPGRQDRYRR
jgi:hypothetical protein